MSLLSAAYPILRIYLSQWETEKPARNTQLTSWHIYLSLPAGSQKSFVFGYRDVLKEIRQRSWMEFFPVVTTISFSSYYGVIRSSWTAFWRNRLGCLFEFQLYITEELINLIKRKANRHFFHSKYFQTNKNPLWMPICLSSW